MIAAQQALPADTLRFAPRAAEARVVSAPIETGSFDRIGAFPFRLPLFTTKLNKDLTSDVLY